jgi:hypothetical protein
MSSPWNGSVIIALKMLYEKTIADWTFRPCYDRTARETFEETLSHFFFLAVNSLDANIYPYRLPA